jgi:SNF2 family DNA or RNA helicase
MKTGRNDPCPCGSGLKYKKCCLAQSNQTNLTPTIKAKEYSKSLNIKDLMSLNFDLELQEFEEIEALSKLEQIKKQNGSFIFLNRNKDDSFYFYVELNKNKSNGYLIIEKDGTIKYSGTKETKVTQSFLLYLLQLIFHNPESFKSIENLDVFKSIAATFKSIFNDEEIKIKSVILVSDMMDLTGGKGELKKVQSAKGVSEKVFFFDKKNNFDDSKKIFHNYYGNHKLFSQDNYFYYYDATLIKQSIQYLFSDGTLISGKDIYLHPYLYLLPKGFLPHEKTRDELIDWPYQGESSYGDQVFKDYNFNALYVISSNAKKLKQFSLLLTDELSTDQNRRFIEIKNTFLLDENNYKLLFGTNSISMESEIKAFPFKEFVSKNNFFHLDQEANLYFCNVNDYICQFASWFNLTYQIEGNNSLSFNQRIESFERLQYFVKRRKHFDFAPDLIKKCTEEPRLCIDIKTDLKEEEKPRISFSASINNTTNKINEIDPFIKKIWYAACSGIGATLDEENTDFASRGAKRANDLKILKSSGFFLFAVARTLEELEVAPIDTIKQFNQFFKKISPELAKHFASLLKIEVLGDLKLDNFVSQRIISTISKILKDLVFGKEFYFQSENKFYQAKLKEGIKESAFFILKIMNLVSGNKMFLKATSRAIEFPQSNEQEDLFLVSIPLTVGQIFECVPSSMKILFNGEEIEKVAQEHIMAQLNFSQEKDTKKDWFELNPEVFLNGKEVSINDNKMLFISKNIIQFSDKFYQISDASIPKLKWLNYFWEKLQGKGGLGKKFSESGFLELPQSETLNLLALKWAGVPVINGGENWDEICTNFDALVERTNKLPIKIKSEKNIKLKDYQKKGVQWLLDLYRIRLGGILADDMGLGKTAQVLHFYKQLNQEKKMMNNLIVVPSSLVYNWESEAKKFAPELKVLTFESKNKDKIKSEIHKKSSFLLICTYGLLATQSDFFKDYQWNTIVFDEAQYLKNIKSTRTTSARELTARSKFCLSGTPMENHFGEFFSLIDLCVPGALGSYKEFMTKFSSAKIKNNSIKDQDLEFLKLKCRPLLLRRIKEEVMKELPEKEEFVKELNFEKIQKNHYKDIAISWNDKVSQLIESNESSGMVQLEMLTALMRLRQVCSFPQLVPGIKYEKIPPKIEILTLQVSEILDNNKNAIVFTNFYQSLELISKYFKKMDINHLCIHGKVTTLARKKILSTFEKEQGCVLLMTLKTGGVGLNLTNSNYVFHLEPWWNPAVENQGTDRVHRIGQKNGVQVYRYIMKHSVEEKMMDLKSKKMVAFKKLFDEDLSEEGIKEKGNEVQKPHSNGLKKEDFQYLLGSP